MSCRDCGTEFVFSAAEQQFYEEMGFRNAPRRCKGCRQARKAEGPPALAAAVAEPRAARRATSDRPTFPATCSECGQQTTVPFEPDPARAAYCPDCYRRRKRVLGLERPTTAG